MATLPLRCSKVKCTLTPRDAVGLVVSAWHVTPYTCACPHVHTCPHTGVPDTLPRQKGLETRAPCQQRAHCAAGSWSLNPARPQGAWALKTAASRAGQTPEQPGWTPGARKQPRSRFLMGHVARPAQLTGPRARLQLGTKTAHWAVHSPARRSGIHAQGARAGDTRREVGASVVGVGAPRTGCSRTPGGAALGRWGGASLSAGAQAVSFSAKSSP